MNAHRPDSTIRHLTPSVHLDVDLDEYLLGGWTESCALLRLSAGCLPGLTIYSSWPAHHQSRCCPAVQRLGAVRRLPAGWGAGGHSNLSRHRAECRAPGAGRPGRDGPGRTGRGGNGGHSAGLGGRQVGRREVLSRDGRPGRQGGGDTAGQGGSQKGLTGRLKCRASGANCGSEAGQSGDGGSTEGSERPAD